jgi:hypothetical protein
MQDPVACLPPIPREIPLQRHLEIIHADVYPLPTQTTELSPDNSRHHRSSRHRACASGAGDPFRDTATRAGSTGCLSGPRPCKQSRIFCLLTICTKATTPAQLTSAQRAVFSKPKVGGRHQSGCLPPRRQLACWESVQLRRWAVRVPLSSWRSLRLHAGVTLSPLY